MILNIKKLIIFIICASFIYPSKLSFEDIPIQEEGRIKPLDTFAKNQLLRIYGKRSISKSKLSTTDWLFGVLTNDKEVLSIPVFNIRNPEVVDGLGLEDRDSHRYTFEEIAISIESNLEMLEKIHKKAEEERELVENQLLEIYFNSLQFKRLQLELSCLTPLISIDESSIADKIDVSIGDKVSFFKIARNLDKMTDLIDSIQSKDPALWNSAESSFYGILETLKSMSTVAMQSRILKIFPPIKEHNSSNWMSPWEIVSFGKLRDSSYDNLLLSIEGYIDAKYNKNDSLINKSIAQYESVLYSHFSDVPSVSMLKRETHYNQSGLFSMSIAFYIIAFMCICLSLLFWPAILKKIALISLLIGFGYHLYGICLRMVIMGRPPVSTLYESIIFVGLISVFCAALIEYSRKDGLGILAASICGAIFHYVSFGYASDGDTLGVLVAVLNSNFWLATHVTTITIGYGTSIVAGIMGHIYLLYSIFYPKNKKKLMSIYNNTFGITILALFFTLFGTILGGIWADQSWGRFWGWDPKENGALLICMWQIFMIHLRLTGMVKGLGFCAGMVINNIIVVMAWFGVNLLSIGLHSYGFASGIATNLAIFTSIELIIASVGYMWSRKRQAV